jgi:TfoX/Sxy family transcriptional regulator of competence genes
MAYNDKLAERIRNRFKELTNVEEKRMMGGLVWMYNDKMCVGVFKEELMCRVDPDSHEKLNGTRGSRTMEFAKRPMIGYLLINESGLKSKADFEYWIKMALDFNRFAKSSKKRARLH